MKITIFLLITSVYMDVPHTRSPKDVRPFPFRCASQTKSNTPTPSFDWFSMANVWPLMLYQTDTPNSSQTVFYMHLLFQIHLNNVSGLLCIDPEMKWKMFIFCHNSLNQHLFLETVRRKLCFLQEQTGAVIQSRSKRTRMWPVQQSKSPAQI